MADALTAELVGHRRCRMCLVVKHVKSFPVDTSRFGGASDACALCVGSLACRECGEADVAKLTKHHSKPMRLCMVCRAEAERQRTAKRPIVCPCGQDDLAMMVVTAKGKVLRICKPCRSVFAENARRTLSESRQFKSRPVACIQCGTNREWALGAKRPPSRCEACRYPKLPLVCRICGTAEGLLSSSKRSRRICRPCHRKEEAARKFAKTGKVVRLKSGDTVGKPSEDAHPKAKRYVPKPIHDDAPKAIRVKWQEPTPTEAERMAKVRAAIKAIPVGVTVTPAMLYDISRLVAEGAL